MMLSASPQSVYVENVRRYWGWFLALGIVMLILGLVALSSLLVATLVKTLVYGWLLLVGGIVTAIGAFRIGGTWNIILGVLLALLFGYAGWMLITNPVLGAAVVTLALGIYLVVGGIFRVIMAFIDRFDGYIWAVVSGVLSIILGAIIWSGWPGTSIWTLGLLLGIDLVMNGVSWIVSSLAARNAETTRSATA